MEQNKMEQNFFTELASRVRASGAFVSGKGDLTEDEFQDIIEYSTFLGGDPDYIRYVLQERGRPLEIMDPTFKSRCLKCTALRNYCCC